MNAVNEANGLITEGVGKVNSLQIQLVICLSGNVSHCPPGGFPELPIHQLRFQGKAFYSKSQAIQNVSELGFI